MAFDIFLSHSSRDAGLVGKAQAELTALGYSVFLDTQALPHVTPDEVTPETAQTLRGHMDKCTSLLYLVSEESSSSRWMPWELGYFDGAHGRVFVLPFDDRAASYAKGREYLKIYPIVPIAGRAEFLEAHVPKAVAESNPSALHRPIFDYAHQENTEGYRNYLLEGFQRSPFDPQFAFRVGGEMTDAFLRLWGMMPEPTRPGADAGRWDK